MDMGLDYWNVVLFKPFLSYLPSILFKKKKDAYYDTVQP